MKFSPILMEDYFTPGFRTKPAVIVGSQSIPFFKGNPKEQAWEGYDAASAVGGDVALVRNFSSDYLTYWKNLMGEVAFINLHGTDPGSFLTDAILDDAQTIASIKHQMQPNAKLMVFIPTEREEKLAQTLGIPLHGNPAFSKQYGTKSGIRELATENHIPLPPGIICTTYDQVKEAIKKLSGQFDEIVMKHDESVSGYFSKRLLVKDISDLRSELDEVAGSKMIPGKRFVDNQDTIVVEGWLKSSAALCAHIEILPGEDPVICAGWQQVIDIDGITYLGGGPLRLSEKALKSFLDEVTKLASALKAAGGVGSYGPDFLITADDETRGNPQTAVLIELNARVPYTAFPLEIIKQVKGIIGSGFYSRHITVSNGISFASISYALQKENLLITHRSPTARGIVPYNIGLLPYGIVDFVSMADTWEEAEQIMQKAVACVAELSM